MIVMPLVPGSLSDRIKACPFDKPCVLSLLSQMVEALCYCHGKGVAHRRVCSDNWLLDQDSHLYLTDFSRSVSLNGEQHDYGPLPGGPDPYTAPEALRLFSPKSTYNLFKADVFALGICAIEVCTGKMGENTSIEQRLHQIQTSYGPVLTEVIGMMVTRDPALRKEATQIRGDVLYKILFERQVPHDITIILEKDEFDYKASVTASMVSPASLSPKNIIQQAKQHLSSACLVSRFNRLWQSNLRQSQLPGDYDLCTRLQSFFCALEKQPQHPGMQDQFYQLMDQLNLLRQSVEQVQGGPGVIFNREGQ